MEFPPEILDLIREYAKPWFRYHREYKSTMNLLHLQRWVTLRHMNDEIRDALMDWHEARETWLTALNRTIYPNTPIGMSKPNMFRLHRQYYEDAQQTKVRAALKLKRLTFLMYGKEKEIYHLAHPKYRYSWL